MSEALHEPVPALIWCPFPDPESAVLATDCLLDERLIACANMVDNVASAFVWNGERSRTRETGALLKTNAALLERAIARLAELHPYDEPAIVGWRCDAATAGAAAWLGSLDG